MRRYEQLSSEFKLQCFEFFYWFARFEFALKENRYIMKGRRNDSAMPDWNKFRDEFAARYAFSDEAKALIKDPPQRQVIANGGYRWEKLDLDHENSDLGKTILILKTIRNNLFHGGKSGQKDWDDPKRNLFFLENGRKILDSLAELGGLGADYERFY